MILDLTETKDLLEEYGKQNSCRASLIIDYDRFFDGSEEWEFIFYGKIENTNEEPYTEKIRTSSLKKLNKKIKELL